MVRGAVLIVAAQAALLAACGYGGPAYREGRSPEVDAVVEMTTTLRFAPEEVAIPAGGTVEWRNTSLVTHTVTAVPELADDPGHVRLPEGAEPFDSGEVPPGGIHRHTFEVPGAYRYVCRPHEGLGMIATVIVEPAG